MVKGDSLTVPHGRNRSLLKSHPPRLICIRRTDRLFRRSWSDGSESSWDTEKLCSHAPRVGAGEPGAAATTRRVEGALATASADGDGPDLLGSTVEVVDELAGFGARGTARDRGRLAPAWIQMLLGVEE